MLQVCSYFEKVLKPQTSIKCLSDVIDTVQQINSILGVSSTNDFVENYNLSEYQVEQAPTIPKFDLCFVDIRDLAESVQGRIPASHQSLTYYKRFLIQSLEILSHLNQIIIFLSGLDPQTSLKMLAWKYVLNQRLQQVPQKQNRQKQLFQSFDTCPIVQQKAIEEQQAKLQMGQISADEQRARQLSPISETFASLIDKTLIMKCQKESDAIFRLMLFVHTFRGILFVFTSQTHFMEQLNHYFNHHNPDIKFLKQLKKQIAQAPALELLLKQENAVDFCQLLQEYVVPPDVMVFENAVGQFQIWTEITNNACDQAIEKQLSVKLPDEKSNLQNLQTLKLSKGATIEQKLTFLLTQDLVQHAISHQHKEPHFYLQLLAFRVSGVLPFFGELQILQVLKAGMDFVRESQPNTYLTQRVPFSQILRLEKMEIENADLLLPKLCRSFLKTHFGEADPLAAVNAALHEMSVAQDERCSNLALAVSKAQGTGLGEFELMERIAGKAAQISKGAIAEEIQQIDMQQ